MAQTYGYPVYPYSFQGDYAYCKKKCKNDYDDRRDCSNDYDDRHNRSNDYDDCYYDNNRGIGASYSTGIGSSLGSI
jgi:hypothetical protein